MRDGDLLVLKGHEVDALLSGQEHALIQMVERVYEAHARGESSLPRSTFLRFPDSRQDRIIALPAYLGSEFEGAGIKWVSSFPGNLERGLDRASAVVILNSPLTGRPQALLEGSIISAKRTAASAALAARTLGNGKRTHAVGLLGCGPINFEIVRFLSGVFPEIEMVSLYDIDSKRARLLKLQCQKTFEGIAVQIVSDVERLFKACSLVSIATTAIEPHILDLSYLTDDSTILHISLRDFAPEVILDCDNVVDDIDHVCQNQTSIHLAEQLVGNREFVRCSLANILMGVAARRGGRGTPVIFSPFGLGILDIAVSGLIYKLALEAGAGTVMSSFLPEHWLQRH